MIWKSRVRLNYHTYRVLFQPRLQSVSRAYRQALIEKLSVEQRQTLNEFLWWRGRYQASLIIGLDTKERVLKAQMVIMLELLLITELKVDLHTILLFSQVVNEYQSAWKRVDYASQLKSKEADVIMELKSERRVPAWMSTLTQMLDLSVVGVSKYVLTVDSSDTISQSYRNDIQTQSVNR